MHLISIDSLTTASIRHLIDRALVFFEDNRANTTPQKSLTNQTVMQVFFEDSTRTSVSFEMAAKKLGAAVININLTASSLNKGESFDDTLHTLNAMRPDYVVARHGQDGIMQHICDLVDCPVISGGEGTQHHPSQALLDAATIYRHKKQLDGLKVVICGDIKHGRVAGSNMTLLTQMGADVHAVCPQEMTPDAVPNNVTIHHDLETGIHNADVIMMLRIQKERLPKSLQISEDTFFKQYGLTHDKLTAAKQDVIVMHPGPMNRGVEICSKLADDTQYSVIREQVKMGVAMRMALFEFIKENT